MEDENGESAENAMERVDSAICDAYRAEAAGIDFAFKNLGRADRVVLVGRLTRIRQGYERGHLQVDIPFFDGEPEAVELGLFDPEEAIKARLSNGDEHRNMRYVSRLLAGERSDDFPGLDQTTIANRIYGVLRKSERGELTVKGMAAEVVRDYWRESGSGYEFEI